MQGGARHGLRAQSRQVAAHRTTAQAHRSRSAARQRRGNGGLEAGSGSRAGGGLAAPPASAFGRFGWSPWRRGRRRLQFRDDRIGSTVTEAGVEVKSPGLLMTCTGTVAGWNLSSVKVTVKLASAAGTETGRASGSTVRRRSSLGARRGRLELELHRRRRRVKKSRPGERRSSRPGMPRQGNHNNSTHLRHSHLRHAATIPVVTIGASHRGATRRGVIVKRWLMCSAGLDSQAIINGLMLVLPEAFTAAGRSFMWPISRSGLSSAIGTSV